MHLNRLKSIYLGLVLCFVLLMSSCSWMGGNTTPSVTPILHESISTIRDLEVTMLNNIKDNGFDSSSTITKGLGGLWVNWRDGTQPLQTNINGTGNPDGPGIDPPRHDILTDLRYIHNLWSYKRLYPADTHFDGEIARYTPIVQYEFAHTHDERGWLYDEFSNLYRLSHDRFYLNTAFRLASSYAQAYNAKVGTIYQTSSDHPYGSYRVDLVLEAGCALIQAGTLFTKPDWQQAGIHILHFVYTHAYIERYHTFANQMDMVLLPNGAINPHEQFYTGRTKYYTVNGHQSQMGEIGQIALSLLETYNVTHEQDFLNKAIELLDTYSLPANPLHMWDNAHGGYFFAVQFSGTTPDQPGDVSIRTKTKEAGRQITMLQSFQLANKLTTNRYKTMEAQMLQVALHDAYYAPGHGVLYEVKADWTPLTFHSGTRNDAVTTEAMGIELESLLAIST